jgi:hypothetical protein
MENNKKQTAVEWFKDVIESFGNKHELQMSWDTFDEVFEQAKEIEKEQLLHFAKLYDDELSEGKIRSREELYNEIFKK